MTDTTCTDRVCRYCVKDISEQEDTLNCRGDICRECNRFITWSRQQRGRIISDEKEKIQAKEKAKKRKKAKKARKARKKNRKKR